jgi:beta-glucosidase
VSPELKLDTFSQSHRSTSPLPSAIEGYNLINGTYACQNKRTLSDLKDTLGFTNGFLVSDWGADHDHVASAIAGMDMEQPSTFDQATINKFEDGTVPMARLDDMVRRILTPMFDVGIFDNRSAYGNTTVDVTSAEHSKNCREFAEQSAVLLKNSESNKGLPLIAPTTIGDAAAQMLRKNAGATINIAVVGDSRYD